jgi:hypothetical protein
MGHGCIYVFFTTPVPGIHETHGLRKPTPKIRLKPTLRGPSLKVLGGKDGILSASDGSLVGNL